MSGVRGPNSALTEFLRSQGINANDIRRRHERRRRNADQQDGEDGEAEAEAQAEIAEHAAEQAEHDHDPEVVRIAQAAARKRRGHFDDLDEQAAANEGTAICAVCNSRFTLTVYSKPAPGVEDGYLCRSCTAKSKETQKQSRSANKGAANKKRKKVAAELLNLRFLVPPSLQELCIARVAEYIDSVDELGSLTVASFNRISRILSKNRRLSPRTMQLFLRPEVSTLEFWDCSDLTPESLNLIPTLCPNLRRLVLGMCGQLDNENLSRLARLESLREIVLDGAFMVRKDAWMDFFDIKGPTLEALQISSVYRVDAEVLALLAESCPDLETLCLQRLCQLYDQTPLLLLTGLSKLRHLELSDLEPQVWSDDALVSILNMVGSQLETLTIRGEGSGLSDRVVEAIAASCGNLQSLELVSLTDITDEAVASMFEHWISANSNTGLQKLSLQRCVQVGDQAVQAAIAHSRATLVELNVNSLKRVSPPTLEMLVTLPNLTKLDIGFVGRVDPKNIYKLSTSKTLKHVLAFGNIRLSGMPLPAGMTVVGTM